MIFLIVEVVKMVLKKITHIQEVILVGLLKIQYQIGYMCNHVDA